LGQGVRRQAGRIFVGHREKEAIALEEGRPEEGQEREALIMQIHLRYCAM